MNRQELISRLVNRKLQAADNGTRNGSAGKVFCVCFASSNTFTRQTPSNSNRKG